MIVDNFTDEIEKDLGLIGLFLSTPWLIYSKKDIPEMLTFLEYEETLAKEYMEVFGFIDCKIKRRIRQWKTAIRQVENYPKLKKIESIIDKENSKSSSDFFVEVRFSKKGYIYFNLVDWNGYGRRASYKRMQQVGSISEEGIEKIKSILRSTRRLKDSPSLRFDILKRDNYTCQLCGRTTKDGIKLEIDHKIPRSKGGTNTIDNLWTLCFDCNRGKSDKDL